MNTRTAILLVAMLAVVGFWAGDQMGLMSFLDEGVSEHEAQMDKISRQISKAEEIIQNGVVADGAMEAFERRSLPYDTTTRSTYQDWLTNLVRNNQFSDSFVGVEVPKSVTVKDGNGKQKEAFKRYTFSLRGLARLENVKQFLYDFYQGGHLQKITSINLSPTTGGRFTVNVSGEALGLTSCDRKSELSKEPGNRVSQVLEAYDQIVQRNIFSREAGAALKSIQLSSITFDKQGLPEAWFKGAQGKLTKRLQRGEKLEISVHEIELLDIQPRSVLIELDGQVLDLEIGQNLHEAVQAKDELAAS